jgi:hypothetical protein
MSHWLPPLLVVSLAGGIGIRAASPQPPKGWETPSMVQFYDVGPTGMSAPENPLASGFALDSSASFEPVSRSNGAAAQSEEAADTGRPLQENPAPLTIRLEYTNQRRRDSIRRQFDEFQCERHGFFYTAGGRCVLPARRHTTRIPRNHPDPRHRHMTRKRARSRPSASPGDTR